MGVGVGVCVRPSSFWRRAILSSISSSSVGCRSITSIFPVSFGVVVVRMCGMVVFIITFTFVCSSPSCCWVPTILLLLVSGLLVIIFFLETIFSRSYFLFGVDLGWFLISICRLPSWFFLLVLMLVG